MVLVQFSWATSDLWLTTVAYSALNKPQIYGGPAKLHCYHCNYHL